MKKIINAPENYVDDMLKGIYAAHSDEVKYTADDLRCYCRAEKKDGKVAIITGGMFWSSSSVPGLCRRWIDRWLWQLGGVFQSPSQSRSITLPKK